MRTIVLSALLLAGCGWKQPSDIETISRDAYLLEEMRRKLRKVTEERDKLIAMLVLQWAVQHEGDEPSFVCVSHDLGSIVRGRDCVEGERVVLLDWLSGRASALLPPSDTVSLTVESIDMLRSD